VEFCDDRPVMRRLLLGVGVSLMLSACTSGAGDVMVPDDPIAVLSPPASSNVVKEKPTLLPEGVDVLAVPEERVIAVWKHPKSARSRSTRGTRSARSPMLIDAANGSSA
jgi:hypothetical protein